VKVILWVNLLDVGVEMADVCHGGAGSSRGRRGREGSMLGDGDVVVVRCGQKGVVACWYVWYIVGNVVS
jgi:hypothetical protein